MFRSDADHILKFDDKLLNPKIDDKEKLWILTSINGIKIP